MPTAVQTQILDLIAARLAIITEANSYSFTVTDIKRASMTPFQKQDLPAINYWAGADELVRMDYGMEVRRLPVFIESHDITRDRPFVDVAFEIAGDIWTALWRDVLAPTPTDNPSAALGGKVDSIVLESIQPLIGEGQSPYCGVLIQITVNYKRRPDAPFIIET
jgi:hypothetical protein